MIKENFDYRHKPSFIIDAYAKDESQVDQFKKELQAKLLRVQINDISKALFEQFILWTIVYSENTHRKLPPLQSL